MLKRRLDRHQERGKRGGDTREVSAGLAANPRLAPPALARLQSRKAPPALAADPSPRPPGQPSGRSGGPVRSAAPAAIGLQRRTPRRRAGRGHAARPGAAQAPPFAPRRNRGRLRRRKARGSARLLSAAPAAPPRPAGRSCAGRPGHRLPAGRGEAGRRRRPRPPGRSCLPPALRRGGRPSLCLQEHRPPGPRTRMRDPVSSGRLPRPGERGTGGAGGALPLRLQPAALRQ